LVQFEAFFHDGNQHVNRDGDPDLGFDRVFRCAVKGFDTQVLLDPFEEQFHVPAEPIQIGDGYGRKRKIVGQKDELFLGGGIEISDTPYLGRKSFLCIKIVSDDNLIASDGFRLCLLGVKPSEAKVVLCTGDKECTGLMHSVQPGKVDITAIHDIKSARLQDKPIQDSNVVYFAGRNDHHAGNAPPNIQKCVQLHRCFSFSESGPGEKGKTQIDRGRIQGVNGLVQFYPDGIVDIEFSGLGNQDLCEIGVNPPIANLIGMGQGVSGDFASNPQMIQLGLSRSETRLDIAQTLSIC